MANFKNQLMKYIKILAVFFVILIITSGCKKTSNMSKNMQASLEEGDLFSKEDIIWGIDDKNLGLPLSCTESDGKIFILDVYSTDGLIKVFDNKNKKFLYKFAKLKSPKSQPVDIAVEGDITYIADMGTKKVYKYKNTKLVKEIQPEENFFPRSVDVDSEGNLVVLSFDKVFIISPEGTFSKFGESGEKEGKLGAIGSEFYIGPSGISVDKNGKIYIADTLNYRIQEFTKEGRFIKQIPLDDAPSDVVALDGKIYITTSSPNLLIYNDNGEFVKEFKLDKKPQGIEDFVSIGRGSSGKVLVLMANQRKIIIFSKDKKIQEYVDKLPDKSFLYPQKLAVDKDKIIAITEDQNEPLNIEYKVVVLNRKGDLLGKLELKDDKQFINPQDVAIIKNNIYLLDLYKIQQFDNKLNHVLSFGKLGNGAGEFGVFENYGILQGPTSIVKGTDNRLFVSDTFNDRIQIFSSKGKYLGEFEVKDPGPIGFNEKKGRLYILSSTDSLISIYTSKGEFKGSFEIATKKNTYEENDFLEFLENQWITVDKPRGLIYVSDANTHKIKVFDINGKLKKSIGGFNTKRKGFYRPKGIFVDEDGFLWIADCGNHRLVKIKI